MERDRSTVRRRESRPQHREPESAPLVAPTATAPKSGPAPKRAEPDTFEALFKADLSGLEALASMDSGELAKLLEGQPRRHRIDIGTQVTGTVTRVGRDQVFVDIGAKSEGQLAREDHPDLKVGDVVKAFVIQADEFATTLSTRLSGAAAGAFLAEAAATGVPVEGKVVSRNAGGFDVRVGAARAFCPISQIDQYPAEDLDSYIGNTYEFKVLESDEKVVVSRKALQRAGRSERREAFFASAQVGQSFEAVVSSAQSFGVFVDVDGAEGLVPKRELSWDDQVDPLSYRKGQKLAVRVIDLDTEKKKITFSAKDEANSPWARIGKDFVVGEVYAARVARLADFGVFAELAPGLTGLLHSSRSTSARPTVGDLIRVRLTQVDVERGRLELASEDFSGDTRGPSPAPTYSDAPEQKVKATVQQVLKNGLVVDLDDGNTGWIPSKEIDLPGNTNIHQRFRPGKIVEARVLEVDASRRRTVLSLRADAARDDGAWRAASQGSGGSFGTFADLLSGVKVGKK